MTLLWPFVWGFNRLNKNVLLFQPVTANEAKSLLKDLSPEILKPLYDYWLNKRKKMVKHL